MKEKIKSLIGNIPKKQRYSLIIILIIMVALPLTVLTVQYQKKYYSRAEQADDKSVTAEQTDKQKNQLLEHYLNTGVTENVFSSPKPLSIPEKSEFSSNELLVKLRNDVKNNIKAQSITFDESVGIQTGVKDLDTVLNKSSNVRTFEQIIQEEPTGLKEDELFSWYKITLKNNQEYISGSYDNSSNKFLDGNVPEELRQLVSELKDSGVVVDVEPNYKLYAFRAPADRAYPGQKRWIKKIDLEGAWNVVRGAKDITVAVIDSGYSSNVFGLGDGITRSSVDKNFINNSKDVSDNLGHGTFVAGIIGATTNNRKGIAAVADKAKIMSLRILDDSGSASLENFARALRYAADNGAKVINISIGGLDHSVLEEAAINYAWNKGSVLIAAAGNLGHKGNPLIYPAAFDKVISVAATDHNDVKAPFSEYGNWVNIAAPGVGIHSIYNQREIISRVCYTEEFASESYAEGVCVSSGTSASAPIVSGIAALIAQQHPNWTNIQIKEKILSSVDNIAGTGEYWRYGRINACKAVDCTVPRVEAAYRGCVQSNSDCGSGQGGGGLPETSCRSNWRLFSANPSNNADEWCKEQTRNDPWGVLHACFICPMYNSSCMENDQCFSDELSVYDTDDSGMCKTKPTSYKCELFAKDNIRNCGPDVYKCVSGSTYYWEKVGPRQGTSVLPSPSA